MKAMFALWWREYLEHKGAFFYAPIAIVGLLALGILMGLGGGRFRATASIIPPANTLFEMGALATMWLWSIYLLLMLFFYYADAFAADRRNNAMFFWKSMPQSDFKILGSKFLTGTLVFPLLILGAVAATAVLLFVTTGVVSLMEPRIGAPDYLTMLGSLLQVVITGFAYFALAMLWYAPFFAWVGLLSAVVGRWSIPLAFVVPALLMLLENMLFFGDVPQGGYVYRYLSWRIQFGFDSTTAQQAFFSNDMLSAPGLIGSLLFNLDWFAVGTGLLFALAAIYAASEYRRRTIS